MASKAKPTSVNIGPKPLIETPWRIESGTDLVTGKVHFKAGVNIAIKPAEQPGGDMVAVVRMDKSIVGLRQNSADPRSGFDIGKPAYYTDNLIFTFKEGDAMSRLLDVARQEIKAGPPLKRPPESSTWEESQPEKLFNAILAKAVAIDPSLSNPRSFDIEKDNGRFITLKDPKEIIGYSPDFLRPHASYIQAKAAEAPKVQLATKDGTPIEVNAPVLMDFTSTKPYTKSVPGQPNFNPEMLEARGVLATDKNSGTNILLHKLGRLDRHAGLPEATGKEQSYDAIGALMNNPARAALAEKINSQLGSAGAGIETAKRGIASHNTKIHAGQDQVRKNSDTVKDAAKEYVIDGLLRTR